MRQEIQVTVRLTFDADASLSRAALMAAIAESLGVLTEHDAASPHDAVCAVDFDIESLKEEAEIYGNV